jgi:hypothetical protein
MFWSDFFVFFYTELLEIRNSTCSHHTNDDGIQVSQANLDFFFIGNEHTKIIDELTVRKEKNKQKKTTLFSSHDNNFFVFGLQIELV